MNDSEAIAAAVCRLEKEAATSGWAVLASETERSRPAVVPLAKFEPVRRVAPPASWTEGEGPDGAVGRSPDGPDRAGVGASRTGKARNIPVEAAIIGRYLSRKASAEETLLEIYHSAISMRRAEEIARALWGRRMSAGTVSAFNRKIAARAELWLNRPIRGPHAYVFLGLLSSKRRDNGRSADLHVRVAVGVNRDGIREVLGVAAGATRDTGVWQDFLRQLVRRGLSGVRLFISDPGPELADALATTFPKTPHQVCIRQLQRELLARVPAAHLSRIAGSLDAIFAGENGDGARRRLLGLAAELRELGLADTVRVLEAASEKLLRYYGFPREHWRVLRSNFPLMQILRQIRERARVVGPFADGHGAALMVGARLRAMEKQWAGARSRLDMRYFAAARPAPNAGRTAAG